MIPRRHLKRALLVWLNLVLLVSLLYSGSRLDLADKRGLLLSQRAEAAVIIPDASIGYNFQLASLRINDHNQQTVLNTETGQVSTSAILDGIRSGSVALGETTVQGTTKVGIYLVKDQLTTLTGATVRLQIPLLGYDGALTETAPGVYTANVSDSVTFAPVFEGQVTESATRSWRIQPLSATFGSEELHGSSVTNFIPNVTIPSNANHQTSMSVSIAAKFLDDAGQPLANKTLRANFGIPARSYTETISLTTDAQGIATYTRTEPFTVSITGGQVANLHTPLSIPGANAESVQILEAWEDEAPPTPAPSDDSQNQGPSGLDGNTAAGLDPINVTTGNFYTQDQDLHLIGRGLNLDFVRTFNSRTEANAAFGYGWAHNYAIAVNEQPDGTVVQTNEQGGQFSFTRNSDGTYTAPAGNYDTLSKLADGSFTLRDKHGITKVFASDGKLLRIVDPNDNQISITYDTSDRPVQILDTVGRTTQLTYDSNNRITRMTDPAGRVFAYAYDGDNLNLVTFPDGKTVRYAYDSNHNLTVITNPDGHRGFVGYNADDRATSFSYEGDNHKVTLAYDFDNQRTSVTDSRGNVTTYHYDFIGGNGVVTQIDNPLGGVQSWTWDSDVNRTSATDALGRATRMTYDANGNLLTQTDALGYVVTNTYEPTYSRLTSTTDMAGARTTLAYDAKGNLTAATDPLGNITRYTNDSAGRAVRVTDPTGVALTLAYDGNSNLAQIIDPSGAKTTMVYDVLGRMTHTTDAAGKSSVMNYDAIGQVTQVTQPDGSSVRYTYNGQGQRLTATDALGAITRFAYDAANRLVNITDPLGSITRFTYDTEGNRTAVTDPKGGTTTYRYDSLNRLVRVIGATGAQTGYQYDAVGNLLQIVDANGNATAYQYDKLNRPSTMIDALGNKQYYSYDARGNMTQFTNAKGNATVYAHDILGRMIRATDPLGNSTRYAYDTLGNLASRTDANGATTQYQYDNLRRLTEVRYPDATSATFTYDALGHVASASNTAGTISYQYDALGRVVSETQPGNRTLRYGYDAAGRRTSLTDPFGRVIRYAYDAAGRNTSVTDPEGRSTSYTYDATGFVTAITNPNSTRTALTYDVLNRLTQVANYGRGDTLDSRFDYTYDTLGNKATATDKDGVVTAYRYDALNRLTKVGRSASSGALDQFEFAYDAAGNRVKQTVGRMAQNQWSSQVTDYTYDAADRLLTANADSFQYDKNGNLLNKSQLGVTTASYRYDYDNRLVQANDVRYSYDPLGRRIARYQGNSSTFFVFDGKRNLLEIDGSTNKAEEYISDADGRLIAKLFLPPPTNQDTVGRYFEYDGFGSVVGMTNQQGNKVTNYRYEAFGAMAEENGSNQGNDLKWMGQYTDTATGLYYMNARWYDPQVGRFLNADPLPGNPFHSGSTNRYAYALNNPIAYEDVSGLSARPQWQDWLSGIANFLIALAVILIVIALIAAIIWMAAMMGPLGGGMLALAGGGAIGGGAAIAAAIAQIAVIAAAAAAALATVLAMAAQGGSGSSGGSDDGSSDDGSGSGNGDADFASEQKLNEHFEKHVVQQGEFNYQSPQEYLQGARNLMRGGDGVDTFVRSNGDKLFYNSSTNEFGVLSKDGFIRTYFKPADGMNYWLKQIGG